MDEGKYIFLFLFLFLFLVSSDIFFMIIVIVLCEGEYQVELPDGRLQIVTYHADHENGYVGKLNR